MTDKDHDDVDANLGENIIIPPMPSSASSPPSSETIMLPNEFIIKIYYLINLMANILYHKC